MTARRLSGERSGKTSIKMPAACEPAAAPEPRMFVVSPPQSPLRRGTERAPYQYGYQPLFQPGHNGPRPRTGGGGERARQSRAGGSPEQSSAAARRAHGVHTLVYFILTVSPGYVRENTAGFAPRSVVAPFLHSRAPEAHGGLAGGAGEPVADLLPVALMGSGNRGEREAMSMRNAIAALMAGFLLLICGVAAYASGIEGGDPGNHGHGPANGDFHSDKGVLP